MDLSQPRPLRLGGTQTFFSARYDGQVIHLDAGDKRSDAIVHALRDGRVFGASPEWKAAVGELLSAGTPVLWPAKRVSSVDFGVPAGYGVGEAPRAPARERSYQGPLG